MQPKTAGPENAFSKAQRDHFKMVVVDAALFTDKLRQCLSGLTPVSWRDESLGSSSLALRHVVLRFRGIL